MSDPTAPANPEAVLPSAVAAALGPRSIVLVGMMGAGKSSVGRRLATSAGLPFVDADNEIEAAAGMSIPEIFAAHGEAAFRSGEARVIARLLDGGPMVLATGGGAFMNAETRAALRAKAVTIWLKADFNVLWRRVKRRSDRPLLKTADPAATLLQLMQQREPIYAEADITIASRDVPHAAMVEAIMRALVAFLGQQGGSAASEASGL